MIYEEHFLNTRKSIEYIIIDYLKVYFYKFLETENNK